MKSTSVPKIVVSADGAGVVSHAGSRLLVDLAAVTGLTGACGEALAGTRKRDGAGHDPGRVWTDLAVTVADGGETITDLAVLRNQGALFGPVASTATAWRVLDSVDAVVLAGLQSARARARSIAWAQRAEVTGAAYGPSRAAGREVDGLVLDFDASLVICHSDKEGADKTFKRTFGYHPLMCFLDNTHEALAGLLRDGNAGSNTAADHVTVTDLAIGQIPDEYRYGTPILIRADGAGATKAWLRHLRGLRDQGMDVRFSVGFTLTDAVKQAIVGGAGRRLDPGDRRRRRGPRRRLGRRDHPPPHAGHQQRRWLAGTPGHRAPGTPRTPARNCRCSSSTTAGATGRSPPIPRSPAAGRSSIWRPATAATPAWKTGSGVGRSPGSAGSRPGTSRSTPPGWRSR